MEMFMTKDELAFRVKELLADEFGLVLEAIKEDDYIEATLGLDSLDRLELVLYIEDKFKVEIPENELPKILTVKDLLEAVQRNYEGKINP